jgi:hypothetical protein
MLYEKDSLFEVKPAKIIYAYSIWTDSYTKMENELIDIEFHKGLPTLDLLQKLSTGCHCIVVLDDLLHEICQSKTVDQLFTLGAHHLKLTIILISQNVFAQGKCMRNITTNLHYMIIFDNKRDTRQIGTMGSQLNAHADLLNAYRDAVREPYSYLVLELAPGLHSRGRWRTRIFPGEYTITYE